MSRKSVSSILISIGSAFALDNGSPIFPLFGDLGENAAHYSGRGHKAVAFALQNSYFTAPHRFTQPLNIVSGHTSVLATMVDDHGSSDIHVTEANGLAAFQTGQKINGWVGICGSQLPNPVSKAGVVVLLALTLFFGRLEVRFQSRITAPSMSNRCL